MARLQRYVLLEGLRPGADTALLFLRLGVGAFLIWGVADNIVSTERMAEFEAFLRRFGFPAPEFMAPLSVWAQFVCGLGFVFGLFTRWAGLLCAVNFIVAVVMVDAQGGVRAAFPSSVLVLLGLYFATNGAGRYSLDRLLEKNRVKG